MLAAQLHVDVAGRNCVAEAHQIALHSSESFDRITYVGLSGFAGKLAGQASSTVFDQKVSDDHLITAPVGRK